MREIHFGTKSEYVRISLPQTCVRPGWLEADVEICVNGFKGQIRASVEAADFERFTVDLRVLFGSLKGDAEFRPREEQLTLLFRGKSGGHVEVTGTAWSKATYENKLEFILELDQSFLSEPLQALESWLGAGGEAA